MGGKKSTFIYYLREIDSRIAIGHLRNMRTGAPRNIGGATQTVEAVPRAVGGGSTSFFDLHPLPPAGEFITEWANRGPPQNECEGPPGC